MLKKRHSSIHIINSLKLLDGSAVELPTEIRYVIMVETNSNSKSKVKLSL
jgi:hypothetical protein